ncbi:MAG TPA: hypothetical protein PLQ89_20820 [Phycisphaerae bacterium]|nr:hypothetical protein [Phycisphaerae bacterium]HOM51850.1 hypothetical protein [Phycisphaerae bacterium]HON65780.1 hypothetical protein [Phycisphaerae bacterium]HOQ88155.1 hypothetical protein [Phycisphaerae bacterium]HPP28619.1 hypothetical protein [Phycisphaerae bacterium]
MRAIMAMIIPAVAASMVGCSGGGNPISMVGTAGKVAFKVIRGAEAEVTPIRMGTPGSLAGYRTLQLGEVTTDVPPICTPQVLTMVRGGIRKGLRHADVIKAFPGGGKTLRFDVQCRIYKEKGLLGGEGRLDWLVTLVDAESNEEVGVVFIEGVSESALEYGADDIAEENTRELAKFLRKHNKRD